jgi:predicted permease
MIWKNRFGGLAPSRDEIEREVDDEVQLHLEMRSKDLQRKGLEPEAARHMALSRFGDINRYRGEMMRTRNGYVKSVERSRHREEIEQDLIFGVRQLFRRPVLPVMIILLLVLGIGVNTAIFSVVKKVLLEPLPFEEPENLMALWQTHQRYSFIPVAGPNFLDWREQSHSFETLVAYEPRPVNLTGSGEAERLQSTRTTTGLFELLRVQPALGRTFAPEEEQPGNGNVVVLSDGLWRRRFRADPHLLGKVITLDGKGYTVVGIMPPGVQHPSPWSIGDTIDLWLAFPRNALERDRDVQSYLVLGRLAENVTREAAQEEMDLIARRLAEAYPGTNEGRGINVVHAHRGLVRRIETQLFLLLGTAGFVLLIVCGNVAGILVARATTRHTEVAIRSSLGASRARVIRQLVTENIPLFLIGGCGGALLAGWSIEGLRALFPSDIPRIQETGIDIWVLAFTLGISLATGLIFGLIPALSASKSDLVESLKHRRGAAHFGRSRLRRLSWWLNSL